MARINVRREIEIERNVVEQYLMDVKDFIKNHRKTVLYSMVGILAVCVIIIALFVYIDSVTSENQERFDRIMAEYKKFYPNDREGIRKTAAELKKFVDSSYFGFSRQMGMYMLGSIYYSEKNYKEAVPYLKKFASKTSSTFFASLALLKAGVSYEELNDFESALKIYKELEDDYSGSPVEDQVFYSMARAFQKKGDIINARNYLNKVVATYPQSLYADKSRKRLFVLKNKN